MYNCLFLLLNKHLRCLFILSFRIFNVHSVLKETGTPGTGRGIFSCAVNMADRENNGKMTNCCVIAAFEKDSLIALIA